MEYVVEIFCLTIISGYLFYKWANKNFKCFSDRNIAHEKPVFLIGNNLSVLEGTESSPELLIRLHNQFKNEKIYGYYNFRDPYFVIRDPELIEKVGIRDFDSFTNRKENKVMMSDETTAGMITVLGDEKWTDMRMTLTPVFTENNISQILDIISACNREAIIYLKKTIKSENTEIDFANYFHRYTNDVIASAAFGLQINSYKDKENEFSHMTLDLLRTRSLCVAVKSFYLTISPQVLKIYRLNRIYIKALTFVKNLIRRTIRLLQKDKMVGGNSIGQNNESEFFRIIMGVFRKSSKAVKSIVLTIFPQISIIFQLYSFVHTIRSYVKGLIYPRSKKIQKEQEQPSLHFEDCEQKEKKNRFFYIGAKILRNINRSIKLLLFSIFPQILWISRFYSIIKAVFNYLKGKTIRQDGFQSNNKKELSKMEATFLKVERFIVIIKLLILTYFPKISKILKLKAFHAKALNYMKSVASHSIRQRQDEKIIRQDMIHLILKKQKETDFGNKSNAEDVTEKYIKQCKEEEIVSQCIMFLFAGFGPIINLLCVTVYELMYNQEIQDKLYYEVAKMNEKLNGAEISYDFLKNMKYLDMVVSESMRKWPSVPLLDRVCTKPYTLTNRAGEFIAEFKPGDVICFSAYGSHFDEDYFKNPFNFEPEKFSEENKRNIRSSTYFPFGVGARSCLGNTFALMVGKIMLYHLILEFKISPGLKTDPNLFAAKRRFQLKQWGFYWMRVTPRIQEYTSEKPADE